MSKTRKIVVVILIVLLCAVIGLGLYYYFVIMKEPSECKHEHFTNGVCDNCGYVCEHRRWRRGYCMVCDKQCEHAWRSGRCVICGYLCEHPNYVNGVCTTCGYHCKHLHFLDGKCTTCGSPCEHNWKNSVCKNCKMRCMHEEHDKDSQICLICGKTVTHNYVNGVCSCGKQFEVYGDWPPLELYEGSDYPGEVEDLTYSAPCFDGSFEGTIEKGLKVYLPYEYDPTGHYDVLILYHGGGDDQGSWCTNWYNIDGRYVVLKNLYDNMIAKKLCKPMIVVCPATGRWIDGKLKDVSIEQNEGELKHCILPYIVDNYATYAESSSLADIQAARAHFGIGGCSNGSLYAYRCGMLANFELFGNYVNISGDNSYAEIVEHINTGNWAKMPVYCYVVGAGDYDSQRNRAVNGFTNIRESTDRIEEGQNAYFVLTTSGHDWKTFSIVLYNALQVFFPETGSM